MKQTEDEIIVELSDPQIAVLSARTPLILDMAGQGAGKSKNIGYSSGMFISDFPEVRGFIGANTNTQLSQSTLASTFNTWRQIYGFTEYDARSNPLGAYVVDKKPPGHFQRFHQVREYSSTISFWNGALIFIGSLENYKAHDGKEFGWGHLDETKDTRKEALKEVILGRLRQYGIWARDDSPEIIYDPAMTPEQAAAGGWFAWNPLYIHTSPALGGVEWLNEMFNLRKFAKEIKDKVTQGAAAFFHKVFSNKTVVIYPVHHNAENLPPNYIANQIASQSDDDAELRVVCGYPFAKMGGEYYPNFRRDKIVSPQKYDPTSATHSSWDFNAVPFMTNENAQIAFEPRYVDLEGMKHFEPADDRVFLDVLVIRFYKEYCFASPKNSTDSICTAYKEDHEPGIGYFYYGDSSGNNRIPGIGRSNFDFIRDAMHEYLHNDSKKVRPANIGIFKRKDLLNKIFRGGIPEVEIYIDPSCEKLIEDLENVREGPKGKVKVKEKGTEGEKYGHPTDAMEYLVCEVCKHFID